MKQIHLGRRVAGAGALIAALATIPASTAAVAQTASAATTCAHAVLTQPFAGDSRWYTLAPGEAADDFAGAGWTLTGRAKIVTAKLSDGTTGPVLDLPAGATATSPAMCVDSSYPIVRMITRTLGTAPDNSTKFKTLSASTGVAAGGMPVLGTPTWAVSPPDNVTSPSPNASEVKFQFAAGSNAKDLQVYNFYVDPRMY